MKWKIENDRYCKIGKVSYEAMYRPVDIPKDFEISYAGDLDIFFPNLRHFLRYRAKKRLPVIRRRHFSKSVWDVQVGGVSGIANFNINYPTVSEALSGAAGDDRECQLSLRLKRHTVKYQDDLDKSLHAIVSSMDAMHAAGWDSKLSGSKEMEI